MLITNQAQSNSTLGNKHSGITSARVNQFRLEVMMNRLTPYDDTNLAQIQRDSFPTGTESPYAYMLGYKGAQVSSTTTTNGEATVTGSAANGINLESSVTGEATVTGGISLVVSLSGTSDGSASTSSALVGVVSLGGSSDGAASTSAGLNLASFISGTSEGVATSSVNLTGTLSMSGDIFVNEGAATTNQIVEGVWSAVAADNNTTGTMGEKLNAAGTAGDPWTADLSTYNTEGTAGRELKKKLDFNKFLGTK